MTITNTTLLAIATVAVGLSAAQAQSSQTYDVCTGILQAGNKMGSNAVADLNPGDWVVRAPDKDGLNCIITRETANRRIINACHHGQRCEVRGILDAIGFYGALVTFKRLIEVKPVVGDASRVEPLPNLPTSPIIGEWCFVQRSDPEITIYERLRPQVRGCKVGITIDQSGYDRNDARHCEFTQVERLTHNAYRTVARCGGTTALTEYSLFQVREDMGGQLMIYDLSNGWR